MEALPPSTNFWNDSRSELRLLYEIGLVLSEQREVNLVLKPILEKMASCIGIIRGSICILNRYTGKIDIAEGHGLSPEQIRSGNYLPGEGITGKVVNTGNPIAIPIISKEPRFLNKTNSRDPQEAERTSFVCVPIKLGIEVIGTISIDIPYNSGRELNNMVWLLTVIAASISQYVRFRQISCEEINDLKEENCRLYAELKKKYETRQTVISRCENMRKIYQQLGMVVSTRATVLLLGESGVGKECLANDIHYTSPRVDKPFVKVNCAAIPHNLVESMLFGHEKGSFTGAHSRHQGYFEQADGGTIFLDEIGELPLPLQSKFLRVLQERQFERIGGKETLSVDVRVIAATNRDLRKMVAEGSFREDLFYRVNVFPIRIPALRERKMDIMLFANYFAGKFAVEYERPRPSFSISATEALNAYDWPGNIRELENTIERAVILSSDGVLHSYHLPETLLKVAGATLRKSGTLQEVLDTVEREMIVEELKRGGGNMSKAAKNLGISERIMGLRVAKYKIDPKAVN